MDIKTLQTVLNTLGVNPPLDTDGDAGKKTMTAIENLLRADGVKNFEDWSDARLQLAAEQLFYKRSKIEVGAIDGLIGEQTRYARTVYAARLKGDKTVETWRDSDPKPTTPIIIPHTAPATTKWPLQSQCNSFFGAVGTRQTLMSFPFPMRIAWEPERTVLKTSCHEKVSEPLRRIFNNTLNHYGYDEIKRLRLDMFGGCLNVRKMRGGSAWSMHSWGIAVDLDPDRNQLNWGRDKASFDDAPYKKFWEFVYAEGAIGLGPERNFDWQHLQFARLA